MANTNKNTLNTDDKIYDNNVLGAGRVTVVPSTQKGTDWNSEGTQNTGGLMEDTYGTYDEDARSDTRKALNRYMSLFDYNEAAIREKFNAATRAEYAAKRIANQQAQAQYGQSVRQAGSTLSDTLSKSLSTAVANGYSRGALAAQQQAAMLGLQETTAAEAAALAQEQQQLAYDEAAAIAKNAVEAEALAQSRINQLAQNSLNQYTADSAVEQSMFYGAASGLANAYSGVKGSQASFHDTDTSAQIAREESLANSFLAALENPANIINLQGGADYIKQCEENNTQPTAMGYLMHAVSDWDGSKLLGGSGGYGSYGGSYDNTGNGPENTSLYNQALVENGRWTKAGHDMLKSVGAGTKLTTEQQNTLLAAFQNAGSDAEESNKMLSAVQKGQIRFVSGATGGFYILVNPADSSFSGSRKARSDAFKTTYGDAFDSMTPSSLSQLKSAFGYTDVIIKNSKGQTYSATQANWENTLEYMEDYTFKKEGNTLVCTNKRWAQSNAENNAAAPKKAAYENGTLVVPKH